MPNNFLDELAQRFAASGYHVDRDLVFQDRTFAVAAKRQFFNWLRFGFAPTGMYFLPQRAKWDYFWRRVEKIVHSWPGQFTMAEYSAADGS